MANQTINLNTCNPGDLLISRHGAILKYVGPTDKNQPEGYFDHKVEYVMVDGELNTGQLGGGTRTNDGYVFRKNRKPETDHDIVSIIRGYSFVETERLEKFFIT